MERVYSVGIIGGGVSGAVTALQLANNGIDSILFEQEDSLVNGPPFCHLHAGGNLYPDISDQQCKTLMKQSIDMAKLFPHSIDKRPTFISIPKTEECEPENITSRLKVLVDYYQNLINEDAENEILGKPENYYKIYNYNEINELAKQESVANPNTFDQWMTNAIKLIDYDKLKMPVFMVQEYGWNLFRLGAHAQLGLNNTELCELKKKTEVTGIIDHSNDDTHYNWEITTKNGIYKTKYLVNSSGFRSGKFDEVLNINTKRLIEFKAAYISKWKSLEGPIPELVFHGKRGTPHGMAQLTPYNGNYYQIHGMTLDITLFEDGLVKSEENQTYNEFTDNIKKKLSREWDEEELLTRTENAIEFVARFMPSFKSAKFGGPALYGAQQVPGTDLSKRVGEVSFPSKFYARSEIIKASSALCIANQIIDKLCEEEIICPKNKKKKNSLLNVISKSEIDTKAAQLAQMRGYPVALAKLMIDK